MKYGLIILGDDGEGLTDDQVRQVVVAVKSGKVFTVETGAPQTPAMPTATLAPQAPAIPTASDFELDADGIPWDERIHANSKAKNKDGTWKRRRGLQDFEFDTVVDELKAEIAASQAPAMPTATPAPQAPAPAMPTAPPMAPPLAAPAPAANVAPTRDFHGLMKHISNSFANKSIDNAYIQTVVDRVNQGFGATLAAITDVANDSRMVEYAWQCFEVDGKAM